MTNISYARSDDEPFSHRLRANLTAAGLVAGFHRLSVHSRDLTMHHGRHAGLIPGEASV